MTHTLQPGDEVRDGDKASGHRVVRFLARDGYCEVYEVVEVATGERLALKCLLPKHADDAKVGERLLREGRALLMLRHPNVVRVHALGRMNQYRPSLPLRRRRTRAGGTRRW